jgi:aryl-alcohol dehydrogenase-like predicted oxidoreductase
MVASVPGVISRRALMRRALSAGTGLILASATRAADRAQLPLITKPIPSSGERIPVIGLGTIWFRDAQYSQLRAVLERMHALGGTLIDTAAAYGESEGVVGRALAETKLRSKMFIATKLSLAGPRAAAPANNGPPPGFAAPPGVDPIPGPPAGITRPQGDGIGGAESFARSLERLRTDHIDLLQVHSLNGTDALLPQMQEWKQGGKIRYVGVTTSSPRQHAELVSTMQHHKLDFIQIDYSIANREAADTVLPVALDRGVGVLVNLPLGRATLLSRLADRPLPVWAADIDVRTWGQFLLKYVVAHPAVTCAIPGSLHLDHLEDNQAAGHGRLPDAGLRKKMEQFWDDVAAAHAS